MRHNIRDTSAFFNARLPSAFPGHADPVIGRYMQDKKLYDYLNRAMSVPIQDRALWLDELRELEPAIADELAGYLEFEESELRTPTYGMMESLDEPFIDDGQLDEHPEYLGRYRLQKLIGHGGMGMVFLAAREDELEIKVAVKLVTDNRREIIRRFDRERRILSQLNHPNIVRPLDSGITEDGRPWVAMEYVDGQPIDDYCDQHKLGIHQRVQLFIKVCEAVRFAHAHLVIHRDIKPTNILVNNHGEPKILDFGIAAVIDPLTGTMESYNTLASDRFMTPEFASPEQISSEALTVSSDIYSLGVLLYWLLCGRSPYVLENRGIGAILYAVRLQDPAGPSRAWRKTTSADSFDEEAYHRAMQCRGLGSRTARSLLSGDLDCIVLKALEKKPEDRFTSLEGFINDLKCYLRDLPVSARSITRFYRVGKFIRRNKPVILLTATLLVSLLTFALVSQYQAHLRVKQRDVALREEAISRQVTEFMVEIYEAVNPYVNRGQEVTAFELLERSSQKLKTELAGTPAVQARLAAAMGRAYLSLGKYPQAIAMLRHALELETHLDSANQIGLYEHLAESYLNQQSVEQSYAFGAKAVEIGRKYRNQHPQPFFDALIAFANASMVRGKLTEAHELLDEAETLFPDTPLKEAEILDLRGGIYHTQLEIGKAGDAYRRSLAIFLQETGPQSVDTLEAMDGLAYHLIGANGLEEALHLLNQVVELRHQIFGPKHPKSVPSKVNLALVLDWLGYKDEAEWRYRDSLALSSEIFGARDPRYTAVIKHNLGYMLFMTGRLEEAEQHLCDALEIRITTQEPCFPDNSLIRMDLGELYASQKRFDASRLMYETALGCFKETDPDNYQVAFIYQHIGNGYLAEGRLQLAREMFLNGVANTRKYGHDNSIAAQIFLDLGSLELKMSTLSEARQYLEYAYRYYQKQPDRERLAMQTARKLGETYLGLGNREQALPLLRESLEWQQQQAQPDLQEIAGIEQLLK